jgi:nucleotide sugar dehydrogenase
LCGLLKVQVIGLGTVGFPTAVHASKFVDVVGYDIDDVKLATASKAMAVAPNLVEADVYVIDVNTRVRCDGKPDMHAIYDVCSHVSKVCPDSLVSIESTVAVGTCRKIAEQFDLKKLVHCPHRFWPFDSARYGVVQTRVLGALNAESMQTGASFYNTLRIPIRGVSSLEVAETAKIAENSYRFVEISFAESLAMACRKHGLPFDEVRGACNTLRREEHGYQVQVLEAKKGIGGECLPKDIHYLLDLDDSPILSVAIEVDRKYRRSVMENPGEVFLNPALLVIGAGKRKEAV